MASYTTVGHGQSFGRWTTVGERFSRPRAHDGAREWFIRCRCVCGAERDVRVAQLINGHSGGCGCVHVGTLIHGQSGVKNRTRLYRIWYGMKQRCSNPRHDSFADYGGRGVTVCEEWTPAFLPFLEWARASGYADTLELDRIDNSGPYAPTNCRWVTSKQNKRNTRRSVHVEAFGERKCLTDWADDPRCTVTKATIRYRMVRMGWSAERAISAPPTSFQERARASFHRESPPTCCH